MTAHDEDPSADIAWMRRLAEEGAETPMRGASILMAAGLIFGFASLFHWAIISDLISFDGSAIGIGWLAATGLFLSLLTVLRLRLGRSEGVRTAANRASGAVWSSVGWGIFALFTALAVVGWRLGDDAVLIGFGLIPSIIMVFYGMGWAVSAAMARSRRLWMLAFASFAAAPLLATLTGLEAQYLAYAAALFLLMALPGFLLMRGARG